MTYQIRKVITRKIWIHNTVKKFPDGNYRITYQVASTVRKTEAEKIFKYPEAHCGILQFKIFMNDTQFLLLRIKTVGLQLNTIQYILL